MNKLSHLLKMSLKVYQERGLLSLLSRVVVYFKDLWEAATFYLMSGCLKGKTFDILYVSGCPGSSRRYRCDNQAQEMRNYGFTSHVVSQNNLLLKLLVKHFRVFIFQRSIYNNHLAAAINEIKKQQKPILFETDDLVFDPSYIPYIHYYNFFSESEKQWYQNGIGRELLEDPYVTHCIVSTDYLAEALKKKYPDKQVIVSTNKMSSEQALWAQEAYEKRDFLKMKDGKIRIGYFSGSQSHDKDFGSVMQALGQILDKHKNVVVMAVGHLGIDKEFLEKYEDQIEIHSFVPLWKLPELIMLADINIIPLEKENPFCQAKSGLKFFEAGILAVPTVATATDPLRRIVREGENGFLAEDQEEWQRKLLLLITDQSLREKIGQAAKQDAQQHYTTEKKHADTQQLSEVIKALLDKQNKNQSL